MKIFLQTDFQNDWAKDKEMTGIFHLSLENTRPDHCAVICKTGLKMYCNCIFDEEDKKE